MIIKEIKRTGGSVGPGEHQQKKRIYVLNNEATVRVLAQPCVLESICVDMDAGKLLVEVPTLCLEYTLNAAHNDQMRAVCKRILQVYGAPHASGLRPAGLSAAELHLALHVHRPFLRQLDLSHTQARVRDSTLELIASNYPNLHTVCLRGCVRVTDYGLQRLARLANSLTSLDVSACSDIGPNTAVSISALTTLRALKIPHVSTVWRDPQLRALTRMQTLTLLHIGYDFMNTAPAEIEPFDEDVEDDEYRRSFCDRVVAAIAALANLQHLHVDDAEGSHTSFMPFSRLTQLTYLHFNGYNDHPTLTPQEVAALVASPALRTLQLPYPDTYTPIDFSQKRHLQYLQSVEFKGGITTFIAQLSHMPHPTALGFLCHDNSPLLPEHLHFLSDHLPFLASIQLPFTMANILDLTSVPSGRRLHTLHLGALTLADSGTLTLMSHLHTLQLNKQTGPPDANPFLLLPSLTSLTISYSNQRATLHPINTHCPTLRRLHLSYCPLPGSFLTSLPDHLPSLNSLSITVPPYVCPEPAEQLQGLTALVDLVTLDVNRFCTTNGGADLAALVGMPKLRDLRVSGRGLTAEDLMAVVPHMGRGLQVLELEGCGVVGQDWDVFVEACPDVMVYG